jgi:cardiolipin synthase
MPHYLLAPSLLVTLDFFLRLYFCLNIVRRKLPVGVAWAWLCLILLLPVLGTVFYLYLGEYRLGQRRQARLKAAISQIHSQFRSVIQAEGQEAGLAEPGRSLALSVRSFFQSPVLLGNDISLLDGADASFPALISDIDLAKHSCDMEFYIWSVRGRADQFAEALIRAQTRGVRCRILVDDIGSRPFLKGPIAKKLRQSGVEIQSALPASLLRSFFTRPDLRLHRKIMVIDGSIAYTGSLNLADPDFFNRNEGVGPWVDALARIQGPAVRALHLVFLGDWSVETGQDLATLESSAPFTNVAAGHEAAIQCIPSGPALTSSTIEETLISALYSARHSLVLTTPYFIPSESLLYALIAAARRKVEVTLIVPARVDSRLIQHASRSFFKELLEAGVKVALFQGGLLHTKSLVIDKSYSIFGSLNLDPRSLRINFEISLAVYDPKFSAALSQLQSQYLAESQILTQASPLPSNPLTQLIEDLARLASPLL